MVEDTVYFGGREPVKLTEPKGVTHIAGLRRASNCAAGFLGELLAAAPYPAGVMGSLIQRVVFIPDISQTTTYRSDGFRLGAGSLVNGPTQKTA